MVSAIKKRKLPDSSKIKNRMSSDLKEDQKKVQQNGIAKSKGKVKERKKPPHYVKGFLFTVITLVVVALLIYHRFDSISRLYTGIKVSRSEGAETEFNNIDDTNRLYLRRGIDRRFNLSLDEFIKLYDAKW